MNLEELRATLINWLDFLKPWTLTSQEWADYVMTDEEYADYITKSEDWEINPNRLHVLLFTNDHSYHISATKDYLGCIAKTRKPRAGETWNRGNDLPDGKFCKETFDSIIRQAFAYEIIAKVKPSKPKADTPEIKV